jgi:hypothetical protein
MKSPMAVASMRSPSAAYGVRVMPEAHSSVRSMTTNRLDSPFISRRSFSRENDRCEVDEPMSMPTEMMTTLSRQ